ncbi:MAG: hypothetical protein IID58_02980 [Proteobacteria bacterium]|nr:hypothetical protein [Pseudomonadota bacterium]
MIQNMALSIVVVTGLYFIALAAASLFLPAQTNRFLLGFAGSPVKHFTELILRFIVGGALVLYAPQMLFSDTFNIFGWVLLVTTTCILLMPWRWHHRFAQYAIPQAIRHLALIGVSSLLLGGVMLVAVIRGSTF